MKETIEKIAENGDFFMFSGWAIIACGALRSSWSPCELSFALLELCEQSCDVLLSFALLELCEQSYDVLLSFALLELCELNASLLA